MDLIKQAFNDTSYEIYQQQNDTSWSNLHLFATAIANIHCVAELVLIDELNLTLKRLLARILASIIDGK